ncbi:MAG: TlpA family protein disulfide reductase [Phycisphaerales bacterium]|nr:MAG: TlpA family protein disulfide reductase [Phycisphaerales bacterium]
MTEQDKQKALRVAVVVSTIVLVVLVIWVVTKQGPTQQPQTAQGQLAEPEQPATPAEIPGEPLKTETGLFGGTRTSLREVIAGARTWGPGFTSWLGQPAPDFTVSDLTGKQHTLSDYRGQDVMLIFWAAWCTPCKMEVPDLAELRKTVGEDKLAMLAISYISPLNTMEMVKKFVADNEEINYSIAATNSSTMPEPYKLVNQIPCSFFIDAEGKIKLATVGLLHLSDIKAILQAE